MVKCTRRRIMALLAQGDDGIRGIKHKYILHQFYLIVVMHFHQFISQFNVGNVL